MNIGYTELRELRLKAYCYDHDMIAIMHHRYHLVLAVDANDTSYGYLLEYSESKENWYILNDGFEKGWLKDKFNQRAAEIDEDLAGLIDL